MTTPTESGSDEPVDATSRSERWHIWARRVVKWAGQQLSRARRAGNWIGRRFLSGGLSSDALLAPVNLVFAFLLTCLVFVCWNSHFSSEIDEKCVGYVHPDLKSPTASKATLEKIGWATNKDSEAMWTELFSDDKKGSTQVEALSWLVTSISTNSQADQKHVLQVLKHQVTGGPSGSVFPLSVKPVDSDTAWDNLDDILEIEPPSDRTGKDFDRRKLAKDMLGPLVAEIQPALRDLKRLGGWIQWLTVFVFWTAVTACIRRSCLLRSLKAPGSEVESWLDQIAIEIQQLTKNESDNEQGQSHRSAIDERIRQLQERAEERVYSRFNFVVGVLPSLGFIGTILGMGEALLKADQLVKSTNKELAIQSMTQELGFAFDTTLVALVCALGAGVIIVLLKRQEHDVFDDRIGVIKRDAGLTLD
jgi:biopolymer transport protein ExbB/TolQ